MSTATVAKKSVKARCSHKQIDLGKFREDLRQRCKLRMREKREEMLNERRFGVTSDNAVEEKLKEIFQAELSELATKDHYEALGGSTELINKLIVSGKVDESVTEDAKLIIEEYHKLKEETSNLLKES